MELHMRTETDNIKPTFVFIKKKVAILNTAKEMT
jgi:hypothetical protein